MRYLMVLLLGFVNGAHLPDGEWDMVFRQTYPGYLFSSGEWKMGNSSQPTFSNLQELEKHRRADGSFHFFLWYPELGEGNEWIQTSNPVTKTSSGVDGYQAIDISYKTERWGGLEYGGVYSLIDGSVNHGNWYYAIGSFEEWNGGIPGPIGAVKKVELYVEQIEGQGTSLQCTKSSEIPIPVLLEGVGHPIEITSPDYPSPFNTSRELSCTWTFSPSYSSKVRITVIENKFANCQVFDNSITIYDDSSDNSLLTYPGLQSTCGQSTLPATGTAVETQGKVTIKFRSNNVNNGDVMLKLVVESSEPRSCPGSSGAQPASQTCPRGPCCQGEDCCVLQLGTDPVEIMSPGYPAVSDNALSCSYKLVAKEGSNIAINFLDLDLAETHNCLTDYVHLIDTATSTHSLIGDAGRSFCGKRLPNYPGPSLLTSAGNSLLVKYHTGRTSNIQRGRGFKASVSAINPLCGPISYKHHYGDSECLATCGEEISPATTISPVCEEVPLILTVLDAATKEPVSAATVNISSVETSLQSITSSRFASHHTGIDGKVEKELSQGGVFQITVNANQYVDEVIDVEMNCNTIACSECAKNITIELTKVDPTDPNITVCPVGMSGVIQVIDSLTKLPISGAAVNVTSTSDDQNAVAENLETNLEGVVTIPLTTNGSYSIDISKDGYNSIQEIAGENCSLSVIVEMSKPFCENVALVVHVRDNVTDSGIEGAFVDIFVVGQDSPINGRSLMTDSSGSVTTNITDGGNYKVGVRKDGMFSQQTDTDIVCDIEKCEECQPALSFNLGRDQLYPDEQFCPDVNLQVDTFDVLTLKEVDAKVTITFIPNQNDREESIVMADNSQVDQEGKLSVPIEHNGEYVIHATAEGYIENRANMIVACNSSDCSSCYPNVSVPLHQEFCQQTYLQITVTDAITNAPIPAAPVRVAIKTENGSALVSSMNTDDLGILAVPVQGMSEYTVLIEKEGYTSFQGSTTVACPRGVSCEMCNPTLEVALNQDFCNQTVSMDITVVDEQNAPIADAAVLVKLTNSAGGASGTNVGGQLSTDDHGVVSPPIFASGTYTISVDALRYLAKSAPINVNKSTSCLTQHIPITIILEKQEEPFCENATMTVTIMDYMTNVPIPSAFVDITSGVVDVALGVQTDQNGQIQVPISKKGNYSLIVSKEGYIQSNGGSEVYCDLTECSSCNPNLTVSVDQPRCPSTTFPITVTDNVTGLPVEGAKVEVVLTSSLSGPSLQQVGDPQYTNQNGTANFNLDMNGNYSISIDAEGYVAEALPLTLDCNPEHCEGCAPAAKTSLERKFCKDKKMTIIVKDAVNNTAVVGAQVKTTTDGLYGTSDAVILTVDETGSVQLPLLSNGIYHMEVSRAGYLTIKSSFQVNVSMGECEMLAPVELHPLSPKLPCDGGVRLSLSWGQTPLDLDLYSYRINKNDTDEDCLTYKCEKKDECEGNTFDVDNKEGGLNGSETITYCDGDNFSNMVYVDDQSGRGSALLSSEAKIVITSETENQIIHLDSSESETNARYWLAGCLTMENGRFEFIKINQFSDQQPHIEEPLHCHSRTALADTIQNNKDSTKATVNISVKDANTNQPLGGALARVASKQESHTRLANDDGVASVRVNANDVYTVDVSLSGYIPAKTSVSVACSGTARTDSCVTDVFVTLLPHNGTGAINLLLNWGRNAKDLDLHVVTVNKNDNRMTCETYFNNMDGCHDVTLDRNVKDGGDNGAETITIEHVTANGGNTYMVFADDNSIGGSSLEASEAHLSITDGENIWLEPMPEFTASTLVGARYWFIGCMEIIGDTFNFVKTGTFSRQSPYPAKKLYCDNLFNGYAPPEKEPFCENAKLNIIVHDSVTNKAISNATILVKHAGDNSEHVVVEDSSPNTDGELGVPITRNGKYLISVEADGYISTEETTMIQCSIGNCSLCDPSMFISLSPALNPGELRLTLNWAEKPLDLDLMAYQRNSSDRSHSCLTSFVNKAGCKGLTFDIDNMDGGNNGPETITFHDIQQNAESIYTVYVRDYKHNPQEFLVSKAHVTITDGIQTARVEMATDVFKNEKYWLAGCLRITPSSYQFIPLNIFLEQKPEVEIPNHCLDVFGFEAPVTTEEPWSILKPNTWFGRK